METRFHAPGGNGCVPVLDPQKAGFKWLAFDLLRLKEGESWESASGNQEWALITMNGKCDVKVEGQLSSHWEGVGSRADAFGGPPAVVYVPRQSRVSVRATSPVLEVGVAKSPCEADLPAKMIAPSEIAQPSSGIGPWRRDVRMVIPPGSPVSQRLIIGETVHNPGQWSGWPPHKHDTLSDDENPLEEFYFFKCKPASGFGVQLMYTPGGRHEALMVSNDDLVVFHEGYHPAVAGPGSAFYYLWVLAGQSKTYKVTIDPQYRWATEAEAIIREMKK